MTDEEIQEVIKLVHSSGGSWDDLRSAALNNVLDFLAPSDSEVSPRMAELRTIVQTLEVQGREMNKIVSERSYPVAAAR